jgi:large exoprotein involved in heme utilization and adhesion
VKSPNFFLINPNGVIFGPSAQLNVGRAFMATTADGINLVDGGNSFTFGTNPSGDKALLSVSPNVLFSLNMGGGSGSIINYGTLQNNNSYIGLIGGNVALDGGRINATRGRVELGGLSEFGTVELGKVDNFRAQFPMNVARGDVSLTNGSVVAVDGSGGGDIAIDARDVTISGGSVLNAGISFGSQTQGAVGGDIKVNATGDLVITEGASSIVNNVGSNSIGKGGNVIIDSNSFSLKDGAAIKASTNGTGSTGKITVTAKKDVSLTGADIFGNASEISTSVEKGATGSAGNISIKSTESSVSLEDATNIKSSTSGTGSAGSITVEAKNASVSLSGARISSTVEAGGVGKGGYLTIEAGSLSLTNGSKLQAIREGLFSPIGGSGKGGSISVTVIGDVSLAGTDLVRFSGVSEINSSVGKGGAGDAGDISIKSTDGSVILKDGAQLTASINGTGKAGKITLTVRSFLGRVVRLR